MIVKSKSPPIKFRQPKKHEATIEAVQNREVIAIIAYSDDSKRHYWYAMKRIIDGPWNTLGRDKSARTIDGCKKEIQRFFQ